LCNPHRLYFNPNKILPENHITRDLIRQPLAEKGIWGKIRNKKIEIQKLQKKAKKGV